MRTFRLAALLVLLAAAAASARLALEPEAMALGRIRDPVWLPSGRFLRLVSFGQRLTLADLYWLKTVMYIGESVLSPKRGWAALLPLGEIVTDLDPRYGYAYQIVGSDLSGLAGELAQSNQILEKGMRNVPDRWSLPFLYAFNKFFHELDFATAAEYARRAAEVGKRPQLALLAANLSLVANTADEYRSSLAFLELAIGQTDSPALRQQLEERAVRVRTFQVLAGLERAIGDFRARHVRAPLCLEELLSTGILREMPRDPSGGTIEYTPSTGAVRSSLLGTREPLEVTR